MRSQKTVFTTYPYLKHIIVRNDTIIKLTLNSKSNYSLNFVNAISFRSLFHKFCAMTLL